MTAGKTIAATIFGLLCLLTTTVLLIGTTISGPVVLIGLVLGGAAAALALSAPSTKQAFGRGFIVFAVVWFVVPVIGAGALGETIQAEGAEAVFSGADGDGRLFVQTALVGASVVLGWVMGTISMVIGLLLNRAPKPKASGPASAD